MNDHVTIHQWISRRRLRAAVDRSLGAKVPKAIFDEAEAYGGPSLLRRTTPPRFRY